MTSVILKNRMKVNAALFLSLPFEPMLTFKNMGRGGRDIWTPIVNLVTSNQNC